MMVLSRLVLNCAPRRLYRLRAALPTQEGPTARLGTGLGPTRQLCTEEDLWVTGGGGKSGAVTGEGSVHLDAVLYNTPSYLTLTLARWLLGLGMT